MLYGSVGGGKERIVVFNKPRMVVGSAEHVDIRVDDDSVFPEHAYITMVGGALHYATRAIEHGPFSTPARPFDGELKLGKVQISLRLGTGTEREARDKVELIEPRPQTPPSPVPSIPAPLSFEEQLAQSGYSPTLRVEQAADRTSVRGDGDVPHVGAVVFVGVVMTVLLFGWVGSKQPQPVQLQLALVGAAFYSVLVFAAWWKWRTDKARARRFVAESFTGAGYRRQGAAELTVNGERVDPQTVCLWRYIRTNEGRPVSDTLMFRVGGVDLALAKGRPREANAALYYALADALGVHAHPMPLRRQLNLKAMLAAGAFLLVALASFLPAIRASINPTLVLGVGLAGCSTAFLMACLFAVPGPCSHEQESLGNAQSGP